MPTMQGAGHAVLIQHELQNIDARLVLNPAFLAVTATHLWQLCSGLVGEVPRQSTWAREQIVPGISKR